LVLATSKIAPDDEAKPIASHYCNRNTAPTLTFATLGAVIIRKGGDTRRSAAFMGHSKGSSNKSAQW
jgi:hypothetical protein